MKTYFYLVQTRRPDGSLCQSTNGAIEARIDNPQDGANLISFLQDATENGLRSTGRWIPGIVIEVVALSPLN